MRECLSKELYTKIRRFTNVPKEDIKIVVNIIVNSIISSNNNRHIVSLDEELNLFDSGYFKIAYNPIPGVIVKFCSINNSTKQEQKLLNYAIKENLSNYFIPTEFINIQSLGSIFIVEEDTHIDVNEFNYIEVQPQIDKFIEEPIEFTYKELTNPNFQILEIPINGNKILSADISDKIWIENAIKTYGIDSFKSFLDFCYEYNVGDLHCGNIGYFRDRPIILDWLSSV